MADTAGWQPIYGSHLEHVLDKPGFPLPAPGIAVMIAGVIVICGLITIGRGGA